MKTIETINKTLSENMKNKGISFNVSEINTGLYNIIIEPYNYKGNKLDGMQIIYENEIFAVSEYQAGKNEDELHVFFETKSFKRALNNMLKGNKRKPSETLKVWN